MTAIDAKGSPLADRPRRRARDRFSAHGLTRFLPIVALFAIWEISARNGFINPELFPPPSRIFQAMEVQAASGALFADIWASLSRVFIGVAIATAIAVPTGAALARYPRLSFYAMPIVELIRPISVIAWIPLAIIWFGLGDHSAWFIIALGAFFPVFTNTYNGIVRLPKVYLQAARTLGLSRVLLVRSVLLPAALPDVITGVRVGLGVGWMCVIAAEMISATSGLGYMIQTARVLIETESVFAGMISIGLVGFAMNLLMVRIGQRLTPWLARAR